jgi:hypothetical protein
VAQGESSELKFQYCPKNKQKPGKLHGFKIVLQSIGKIFAHLDESRRNWTSPGFEF